MTAGHVGGVDGPAPVYRRTALLDAREPRRGGTKRGRPSFRAENGAGDEDFIRRLRMGALKLQSAWQERREKALLVSYEDFITDPAATLRDVIRYLGERVTPDAIDEMISRVNADRSNLAAHRTSAAAESSIGRWRTELDELLRHAYAESFDDILPTFGYGPSISPRTAEPVGS